MQATRSVIVRLIKAIGLAAAIALVSAGAPGTVAQAASGFAAFVDGLWPEAAARGITRATFDAAFAKLTPDPSIEPLLGRQPEFSQSIGAYLTSQVTPSRIATGRAMLTRWRADLDGIERRYQVPRAILVAVWGLETAYGAAAGHKDVIRSIATLAFLGYRPDLYRAELLAALTMLQDGDVRRTDMRGSWAGAMGQPQFMPSSFEAFAVDWTHAGRRDIWSNVPDALASIANFIRQHGWQTERPWGFEVRLPQDFDYRMARASFPDWAARGLARADGRPLPDTGEGILFFPAGADGPAFLVTENFEVLKTYNFSDAYVLSVAQLADRIQGGLPIAAAWPEAAPLSRDARIALQARLVALGYNVDNREGRISLALRDVIRAAQTRVSMRPDGNPTAQLLSALQSLAAAP